jgi:putative phage-type endonuclease
VSEQQQGSQEWIAARLGKVTASRVADVIAKTKTGWGASRANYMAELIAERLTGAPGDQFINAAMKWGIETEAEARAAYAFYVDVDVVEVGFIEHPKIPSTGASPDGQVGDDGLVEFKCPNTATHIDTLLGGPIAAKYIAQMQWQMACTNRRWCDWVSYDPRLPGSMRLFVQRLQRDEVMIAELEKLIAAFLAELDQKVSALSERFGQKEAA